jgi:tetratricopeptide (TPR) repeat protein
MNVERIECTRTAAGVVRRIGGMGVVVGMAAALMLAGGAYAQTQNSLRFTNVAENSTDHTRGTRAMDQQPAPTTSEGLPVITPELRADILVAHEHYAEAIEAYRKIQPQTAELYNKIGIAYQRMAMNEEAAENYDRASHVDPKFAAAYNNLGTVYFLQRDNNRAKRLYKKSIKLDAETAPYWSNLGAVYLAQKQYSDGAEAYERAFMLNPDIFQDLALNGIHQYETPQELAQMYLCFAEIYAHAGMKTQAIDFLRKALNEDAKYREQFAQDQQLATLHGTPEFEQLIAGVHKP